MLLFPSDFLWSPKSLQSGHVCKLGCKIKICTLDVLLTSLLVSVPPLPYGIAPHRGQHNVWGEWAEKKSKKNSHRLGYPKKEASRGGVFKVQDVRCLVQEFRTYMDNIFQFPEITETFQPQIQKVNT